MIFPPEEPILSPTLSDLAFRASLEPAREAWRETTEALMTHLIAAANQRSGSAKPDGLFVGADTWAKINGWSIEHAQAWLEANGQMTETGLWYVSRDMHA
ncbi:MAG TPA: hypothetical protein VEL07_19300 [Planctomycetota bacterium]|nr:hypothetical protein [Planctomycetota bacterium]